MSKHIKKINKKPVAAPAKKGGNFRKIGEATAKRMQDKVAQRKQQKSRPKDFDEEIDSDMSEDIDEPEIEAKPRQGKSI
jgi:hypothetical protein